MRVMEKNNRTFGGCLGMLLIAGLVGCVLAVAVMGAVKLGMIWFG